MSAASEVRKFVYQAIRHGVDVRHRDGNGHYPVYHDGIRVGTIPYSPSDSRWKRQAIVMIRRTTGVDLRTTTRKPKRHAEPAASTGPGSPRTD